MQPEEEYYDPEADVRPPSPGLVPTKINYKPDITPPPYIQTSSSASPASSESEEGRNNREGLGASAQGSGRKKSNRKRRKKGRTRPSQGDAVLISHLDPNRPDIAREVAQKALNSASQSEASDEAEQDMSGDGDDEDDGRTEHYYPNHANAKGLEDTARTALNNVVTEYAAAEKPAVCVSSGMPGVLNRGMQNPGSNSENLSRRTTLDDLLDPKTRLKLPHPPSPLAIPLPPSERNGEGEDDSIATSPALAPFLTPKAEANPASTLPAMQKSPPRSSSTRSPDGNQSLPSLQTALGGIADGPIVETPNGLSPFSQNPGPSPTLTRSPFVPGNSPSFHSQSSPASSKDLTGRSPAVYPSHTSFWRTTSQESSLSTASPAPSGPGLTPSTSYPMPKEMASPENSTAPQSLIVPSAANGPFASTPFKCTHPGCNALPFQTQYLLNSHANVHSSSRPHYCPVKSCPRSMGGKGFKRKNEMIRHGLVHDSPGYVCPFCADQQHKYPRPDNLQRHVRVHHPDKQRDDPQLRSVLAMRSGDGGRGRRRRVGT